MDMMVVAAFVAFFALVLAWLAAPSGVVQRPAAVADPAAVGAD